MAYVSSGPLEPLVQCQPICVLTTQVLATDGNEAQLRHATPAPNVTYQHGDAHSIPLQDSSADLVTAASALHWFELPQFYKEVRRVLKTHGCLAAWAIPLVRGMVLTVHAWTVSASVPYQTTVNY